MYVCQLTTKDQTVIEAAIWKYLKENDMGLFPIYAEAMSDKVENLPYEILDEAKIDMSKYRRWGYK